jgi:hypothetical protein
METTRRQELPEGSWEPSGDRNIRAQGEPSGDRHEQGLEGTTRVQEGTTRRQELPEDMWKPLGDRSYQEAGGNHQETRTTRRQEVQ